MNYKECLTSTLLCNCKKPSWLKWKHNGSWLIAGCRWGWHKQRGGTLDNSFGRKMAAIKHQGRLKFCKKYKDRRKKSVCRVTFFNLCFRFLWYVFVKEQVNSLTFFFFFFTDFWLGNHDSFKSFLTPEKKEQEVRVSTKSCWDKNWWLSLVAWEHPCTKATVLDVDNPGYVHALWPFASCLFLVSPPPFLSNHSLIKGVSDR